LASPGTKITILVDNNALQIVANGAPAKFACEHGLALWIESEGRRILFDTGQGPSLGVNALALGADLAKTDVLVLSHGHYDHTGGATQVLREATQVHVYCHPGIFQSRYAVREGKAEPIGLPEDSAEALTKLPPQRLHRLQEPTRLTERLGVTGSIPRSTGYEDTGGPFYLDTAGRRPDPLEDDLALWIDTNEGLVVCLGCAHSGAVNTLQYVRTLNEHKSVRAVVGGFHLVNADEERLGKTVTALRALDIPLLVPCHCTGADALRRLAEELGSPVSPGAVGMTFEF
jgi:7,8-dihydropterin-6-yl-methyl-4-(beta-D-ribofuranosyl)aminobenzene 5'-phosphate synthase